MAVGVLNSARQNQKLINIIVLLILINHKKYSKALHIPLPRRNFDLLFSTFLLSWLQETQELIIDLIDFNR